MLGSKIDLNLQSSLKECESRRRNEGNLRTQNPRGVKANSRSHGYKFGRSKIDRAEGAKHC